MSASHGSLERHHEPPAPTTVDGGVLVQPWCRSENLPPQMEGGNVQVRLLSVCVWSWIGQAARDSTPVSRGTVLLSNEVDDTEGLNREQVGEEVTGGKRQRGPFNKDVTTR